MLAALLNNAEWWVGAALVVFLGLLVWLKVPSMAAKGLDAQADKIRGDLAEAEALRKEAEALLASIKTERDEAERTAREMLTNAEAEARRIATEAKAKLEDQIKRRGELAERKIAQAQAQAEAEVKAAAADLAADVATQVLAGRLSGLKSDPLVDRAVSDLPGRLG